ncbi:MAG TPA: AI-2E family transporter, partial [Halieaceae bacterium]|nr:AI-2E family transporter [Halieaceae bacterium]
MLDIFNKWYKRYLFEEESVLLLVLLLLAVVLLATIGDILAPVVASIVLAYLMQGLAGRLERRGLPGWVGVSVAYTLFVGIFFGVTLGLLPLVWRQLVALAAETPRMLEQGRELLVLLPGRYPDVVSQQQINQMVALAQAELGGLGQQVVTRSLATIPSILTLLVYMILIPILVFFFLKDRRQILAWLATFLPTERPLLRRIWSEMDTQVANYARGKVLEILIVGSVSYVSFTFLDLNYAALLALCVGLSVIIPYLGAALVTLPVLLVG